MNKKTSSTFGILVVLIIVGFFGYAFLMGDRNTEMIQEEKEVVMNEIENKNELETNNNWKLVSGDPTKDCSLVTYEGESQISGWYEWETSYVEKEWLFRISDEDIQLKKLPIDMDSVRPFIKITNADEELEDSLKNASESMPETVTVNEFSYYCEGVPQVLVAEGYKKYIFNEIDSHRDKSFKLFYPEDGEISSERGSDKIVYSINNKKCGITIFPMVGGIEEDPGPDFYSNIEWLDINGKKWRNLVWKWKGDYINYSFSLKDDSSYIFGADTNNIDECLDSYKDILSTFEFIQQ